MKRIIFISLALTATILFIFPGCEEETINQKPICTITNPISGITLYIDTIINITVNAKDKDGEVNQVLFFLGNKKLSSDSNIPFEYKWNTAGILKGSYNLIAKAIDNDGAIGEDSIRISINILAGTKKWQFKADGRLCSPIIGHDGTIYAGTYKSNIDYYLYAINPDGTEKWHFNSIHMGHPRICSAVDLNGTIYAGANSFPEFIHAINPDGTLKWHFNNTNDAIQTSPTIGPDGTIYFGTNHGNLYAINSDGSLKWKLEMIGSISTTPAIASNGTIYIGSYKGGEEKGSYFYAINPDGSLKWKIEPDTIPNDNLIESATIGLNDIIYFSFIQDYLYAINPDGTEKWRYENKSWFSFAPAIDADGTIYIGSENNLHAINSNGSLKWKLSLQNIIFYPPAIGNDGTIYIAPDDEYVYAINPNGSIKWKFTSANKISSSIAISSEGTIYVTSEDNYLYAINGEPTVSDSNWPMFQNNSQNTGRKNKKNGY